MHSQLNQAQQDTKFTFAVISDTHIPEKSTDVVKISDGWNGSPISINPTNNTRSTLEQLSNYATHSRPKALVHLGDIGDNLGLATNKSYQSWNAILSESYFQSTDFFGALGNHDSLNELRESLDLGPHRAIDDKTKLAYEFKLGHTRCLMLDARIDQGATGEINQEQIEWLKEKLSETLTFEKILIFCHFPLVEDTIPWHNHFMLVKNGEDIHKILASFSDKILGVFSGHAHHSRTAIRDGIPYLAIPSSSYPFRADLDANNRHMVVDTKFGSVGYDLFTIVQRLDSPPILTRRSFQEEFVFSQ
jgi:3',5'-cyclic AMP phosphodiesterase CpdA